MFKEIDQKKNEAWSKGVDIIDLGVGDPDHPTPQRIIDAMSAAVKDPGNHHYPSYSGSGEFKKAVAEWYMNRFSVFLDPETEVITLIGAKEGIAHIPLAFINPGDFALVPSPAYPVYDISVMFAAGNPYYMPLLKENGFLPDLASIPSEICKKAKMIWLNYPNNPTGAVAEKDYFQGLLEFAHKYGLLICHDLCYSEIAFDGYRPMSILEIEGAKDICIEFHSLSKTFNMTGWRIGYAVGNPDAVNGLGAIKSNIDSGVFKAIQVAGIEALKGEKEFTPPIVEVYRERRDIMVKGLRECGFEVERPKATFYLWIPVPEGYTSIGLASKLLTEAGIVVTPGNGFGAPGEGYIRIALTREKTRLLEAIDRIENIGF